MFFKLSKRKDTRFPEHSRLGDWWVSHDAGWNATEQTVRKGYRFDSLQHGNHASFELNENCISLKHDEERSFPLWWDSTTASLTNMPSTAMRIWADEQIEIRNLKCEIAKVNHVQTVEPGTVTVDQAAEQIIDRTVHRFDLINSEFSCPKRLFLTGGMDTATLLALSTWSEPFESVDYEHFEYDWFTNNNLPIIQSINDNWGYLQIHHWRTPTVLATGGCGDEFFMRGPGALAKYFAWHDIDFVELLQSRAGYHVEYYLKDKNQKVFYNYYDQRRSLRKSLPTYPHLVNEIVNNNLNDHQHWHLGNTLTFTPFKDIEITRIVLRLSLEDMIEHAIDAVVNRRIIQRIKPSILDCVSTSKNINTRSKLL